jgi:hypothetical protein
VFQSQWNNGKERQKGLAFDRLCPFPYIALAEKHAAHEKVTRTWAATKGKDV